MTPATTSLVIVLSANLWVVSAVSAQDRGPTDWSDWEQYRDTVSHPCAAIKPADLERAQRNIERYDWAREYVSKLSDGAEATLGEITPEYLERMIPRTTPGCVGPCPACRAQGLPWHPNGQWSWSADRPDEITCSVCETVFPNDEFPETIRLCSTWDPEQEFGFVGGETFRCFGYTRARPSISGIIRARKVGHATGRMSTLALAYALTGDARYARGTKAFLLRFAEVYPKYLVRAGYGYGEYTDCDPHVAAERISDLPNDELVYPPNTPDRKLYAGYWAASRIGSSGMDGGWTSAVAQAYDLTCTAADDNGPVYSEDERLCIEHDVLLEASYLAVCDPSINNKSVGNRAGAAMVGMVVGHPGLVRFGIDGFRRTVDGWFLPDGGTSESPGYALMTMGGIRNCALMFRDYSDPPGYAAPGGSRLDGFDACRDTRYGDCWQSLIWTLQGNLRHPPSADSYRTTSISPSFAELIAVAYPTDEHLAFLKAIVGGSDQPGSPRDALLYREPGIEERVVPPFSLPDTVFPYLAQAYTRTGETSRDSLVLLNASDWGGHHHLDSLDLYYWKDGRELLSDLGYLWDHPDSYQTRRTFAHNLVMLGNADQRSRGRGGSFHIFSLTPQVKVMEASSVAYPEARIYRRTCVQMDHGEAGAYFVDIFRVDADGQRQYVFHGPGNDYAVGGLSLGPPITEERTARFALRFHLPQVSEIFVDDVEIRRVDDEGNEGPNLAPNPSALDGAEAGRPDGWGVYLGDGSAECGTAGPGRADAACVRFAATTPHDNGRMNVALLVGESDGYTGPNAISGVLGASYKVRFWLRGDAPKVNVDVVTWPNDPSSSGDRQHITMAQVSATDEWTPHEMEFTLGAQDLPLNKVEQASGERPWRVVWTLEDEYEFAALTPGQPGETVLIGEGWGQRDHRNTDRGATLPYVVRRVDSPGLHAFVSVFAGAPPGRLPLKAVRVLDLPEGAPAAAVVIEVDTTAGTDVIISMLQPRMLTLTTALGDLTTDAHVAAVLASGGACMVGGTVLSGEGSELSAARATYSGTILGHGSDSGSSWFDLDGEVPEDAVGQTLFVNDGDYVRAYPVRGVRRTDSGVRVFVKRDHVGFEARAGEDWEYLPTVASARHGTSG